jgi:hypothetical protein
LPGFRVSFEIAEHPSLVGVSLEQTEKIMTKLKTLSAAVALVSAVIAAPVFAHDAGGPASHGGLKSRSGSTYHHARAHHRRYVSRAYNPHVSGAYNPPNGRFDPDPEFQRNIENFGFSGRDPSRIGGEDPSLHPSQY